MTLRDTLAAAAERAWFAGASDAMPEPWTPLAGMALADPDFRKALTDALDAAVSDEYIDVWWFDAEAVVERMLSA